MNWELAASSWPLLVGGWWAWTSVVLHTLYGARRVVYILPLIVTVLLYLNRLFELLWTGPVTGTLAHPAVAIIVAGGGAAGWAAALVGLWWPGEEDGALR